MLQGIDENGKKIYPKSPVTTRREQEIFADRKRDEIKAEGELIAIGVQGHLHEISGNFQNLTCEIYDNLVSINNKLNTISGDDDSLFPPLNNIKSEATNWLHEMSLIESNLQIVCMRTKEALRRLNDLI